MRARESLTLFPPRGPIRAGEKRALQLELAHHSGRAPVRARRRHRREGARVAMTRVNGRRRVKKVCLRLATGNENVAA